METGECNGYRTIKMKKFISYIAITFLLVGIFVPTDFVHAAFWYDAVNSTVGGILGYLSYFILKIISLFMGLAGLLLNYVITETVVKMAENISGPSMAGINVAWKVIRDLMNITFIFLLIYKGILTIIGQSDVGKVRSFIVGIVMAAILINFSLFFTKLLIDASNVVTIGFYNSIIGPEAIARNQGLSDAYQQSIGLQGFFGEDGIADNFSKINAGGDDYAMLTIGVMASILFLITTFVFLAVSVMFIVRYIVLIVLLMLSPIAYMGMALPAMKENASKWWSSLNGQLLFAPIYMIMTWVVITLIQGFSISPDNWTKFADSGTIRDSIGLFFNFIVVIGLSIVSLVISKQYSTQGAAQIGQFAGKATAFAGGVFMGGAGRLGRNTIGRWGNAAANDEELKERAKTSRLARIQLGAANQAAKRSFDVRAVNVAGMGVGSIAGFGKVDTKKENYRAIRAEEVEKAEKKTIQYKPSDTHYAEAKKADAARQEAAKKRLREESDFLLPSEIEELKRQSESKPEEQKLNENYRQRTAAVADRVGHLEKSDTAMNKAWRVIANTVGTAANVAGIPGVSMPKNKKDREALAHKIRAQGTAKSKKELAAMATLEAQKEENDQTAAAAGTAGATPATPAVPPTPPPTPRAGGPAAT